MPQGLHRYQQEGDEHFITFGCHQRLPYLNTPASKTLFLQSLEATRKNYHLQVLGYVLMPEHVHLLLTEPDQNRLSTAIQALKLSVSKLSQPKPFWLARYHDRNIFTHEARVKVLRYMHRNPVAQRLVEHPEDWPWSTYSFYATDTPTPVRITNSSYGQDIQLIHVPHQQACALPSAASCIRWANHHRLSRKTSSSRKIPVKPLTGLCRSLQ